MSDKMDELRKKNVKDFFIAIFGLLMAVTFFSICIISEATWIKVFLVLMATMACSAALYLLIIAAIKEAYREIKELDS